LERQGDQAMTVRRIITIQARDLKTGVVGTLGALSPENSIAFAEENYSPLIAMAERAAATWQSSWCDAYKYDICVFDSDHKPRVFAEAAQ